MWLVTLKEANFKGLRLPHPKTCGESRPVLTVLGDTPPERSPPVLGDPIPWIWQLVAENGCLHYVQHAVGWLEISVSRADSPALKVLKKKKKCGEKNRVLFLNTFLVFVPVIFICAPERYKQAHWGWLSRQYTNMYTQHCYTGLPCTGIFLLVPLALHLTCWGLQRKMLLCLLILNHWMIPICSVT